MKLALSIAAGLILLLCGKTVRATNKAALSKPEIDGPITARRTDFRACFDRLLIWNPRLEGKVVVSFFIQPSGKVLIAAIKEATLKNDSLNQCVLARLREIKFPPSRVTTNVGAYPFHYSPAERSGSEPPAFGGETESVKKAFMEQRSKLYKADSDESERLEAIRRMERQSPFEKVTEAYEALLVQRPDSTYTRAMFALSLAGRGKFDEAGAQRDLIESKSPKSPDGALLSTMLSAIKFLGDEKEGRAASIFWQEWLRAIHRVAADSEGKVAEQLGAELVNILSSSAVGRCYVWNPDACPTRLQKGRERLARDLARNIGKKNAVKEFLGRGTRDLEGGYSIGALDEFDIVLTFDPKAAAAWCGAGRAYENLGERDLASELLGKGRRLDPKSAACKGDKE